jgi:hypothetical protein
MNDIAMKHGNLKIVIDERTGSLTRIEDTRRGIVHLDARAGGRDDGRLFRVMVPVPEWTSRHLDNAFAPPEVRREGAVLLLHWANLPCFGADSGIAATARIEPAPVPDEIRFTLTVKNDGPVNAIDVFFPAVSGWTGIGGPGRDTMILGGASGKNVARQDPHAFPINKGMTYARVHQRASCSYPVSLYAPWADVSGPGGGMSCMLYNETAKNATFCMENLAGYEPGLRLCFGWQMPCVIRPGETWTSPPVGIAVHGGDWHDTADRYRTWAQRWWTAPPIPRRLRESIGFQNVWLRGIDGTPFHGFDEIPAIAAAGRRYGVDDLCLWDYTCNGNYAKYADVDLLDFTGEQKRLLKAGLARAKAEGTNVNALVNFRLLNAAQSLFEREAHGEIIKNYDGSPRFETYPANHHNMSWWPTHLGPNCYLASPFAPSYRKRVLRQVREYLDLGFTSLFYDQPFEQRPDYGRRAEGCAPEDTMGAVVSLLREVREVLRENDPDSYMIGEFCDQFAAQHIDLWMSWYTDVNELIRSRYVLPGPLQSWVVDVDPGQASHAFALGSYLCLCTHGNEGTLADVPDFGEHVRHLAELRKRTAERTVNARFNDTRGLTMDADAGVVAYSFDGPQGAAVAIAATQGAGKAVVSVDRSCFSTPGGCEGRLDRLDGSQAAVSGDRLEIELGAHDAAVWSL